MLVFLYVLIAFGAFWEAFESAPPRVEGRPLPRLAGALLIGIFWPVLIGLKIVQEF